MHAAIALKKADQLRPLQSAERFSLARPTLKWGSGPGPSRNWNTWPMLKPKNVLYPYCLARIDEDQHLYTAAVQRLQAVTAANSVFWRAWDNLGLSLVGSGQLSEAITSYRTEVRLNRNQAVRSPWPALNLGTLLTKTGALIEAEELLREALPYDGNLAVAHDRLGVNLRKQSKIESAIWNSAATELDPSATEPLNSLPQIYRKQGQTKAAAEAFEKFRP